jgi:hypothetical protein
MMYKILPILILALSCHIYGQKTEKINVPKRVVYKYCKPKMYEEAKSIVQKELTDLPDYSLIDKIVFVGPVLWTRYGKVENLSNIEGGNLTLLVDNKQLTGKMTQSIEDTKRVWDQLREEVKGIDFKLRKATFDELDYYWSVISWDIEEPLIIVETSLHKYILDIAPTTMKLLWIDESPR